MRKVDFDLKQVRLDKSVKNIKELYDLAFIGISTNALNLEKFKLDINFGTTQRELISADKLIFKQIKVLKELDSLFQNDKSYKELCVRLMQIHKQIFKVLKEEYKISNCEIDAQGNLEYSRI